MPPLDRLLAPKEVATYLGVSQRTALRYMSSGLLPAVRVGKLWRISEKQLHSIGLTGIPMFTEREMTMARMVFCSRSPLADAEIKDDFPPVIMDDFPPVAS